VLLRLCGGHSGVCPFRTFRPSVGYDDDGVLGPDFFCEVDWVGVVVFLNKFFLGSKKASFSGQLLFEFVQV
jgi:hypothetical protein